MMRSSLVLWVFISTSAAFTSRSSPPRRSFVVSNSNSDGFYFGDNIPSASRAKRLQDEEQTRDRFAEGNDLTKLRSDILSLKENLEWAKAIGDASRIHDLETTIDKWEWKDPEAAYAKALSMVESLSKVKGEGQEALINNWVQEAVVARSCIPRFNLEGLWVGNYGEHGYELINVTYTGDTLYATKVTGDRTVPRHQLTFTANLAPPKNNTTPMAPIELTKEAATKWGIDQLERYPGQGQIAKAGFVDAKMVEGQLIMFEHHFSFVWVETRHHVFFGRPTPQVTMRMLRDVIAKEDEVENMRMHLEKSYDMDFTESLARAMTGEGQEPFRRISLQEELKQLETLEPKSSSADPGSAGYNFWNVQKWRGYLDDVLSDDKTNNS